VATCAPFHDSLSFFDEGVFAVIHREHLIAADERERQRFFRQILVTTAEAEAAGANILWRRDRSGRGSSVELDNGSLDGERVTAAAAHAVAELDATATERRWQLDRQGAVACGATLRERGCHAPPVARPNTMPFRLPQPWSCHCAVRPVAPSISRPHGFM